MESVRGSLAASSTTPLTIIFGPNLARNKLALYKSVSRIEAAIGIKTGHGLSCWDGIQSGNGKMCRLDNGGYRSDGRKQYELRDLNIDLWSPSTSTSDGSATVSHGLTQVQVNVFGPREPRSRSQALHDRLFVNVEVGMAPFSTNERRLRGRGDKRVVELSAAIKNTFDPVIQKHLFPRSELDIYVQILQQDGGVLQTCINATTMALISAGIPLIDFVCGLTVGVHTTDVLLDLTNLEENDVPHLTIATIPRSGKVTLVSMETRLNIERFGEMLKLGEQAGRVVGEEMRDIVRAWGEDRAKTQKMVG